MFMSPLLSLSLSLSLSFHLILRDREADMIVKIAKHVSDVLNYTPSRDFDDYVGLRPHITKINSLLCPESGDVRMIGILGPPGIGKTTVARSLEISNLLFL